MQLRGSLICLACLTPYIADAQEVPERLRECARAVRASFPEPSANTPPHILGAAQDRVRQFRESMSADEFEECSQLAFIGVDHGFVPVTYVLDTGRWVDLSVRGATIVNQGTRTQFKWGFAREGIRFLPSRHSEIATAEGRRHFIEVFAWTRENPRRDSWQLGWHPFEISGDELIPIGIEPLLSIAAALPPDAASAHVFGMATIQLNDDGRVEWRVARDANQQRGVIPSPAERRAYAAARDRQQAAIDKVDWTRVADVRRVPALAYGDNDGCAKIVVYGWTNDRMEAVHLRADAELLRLSRTPQTLDVATQPTAIQLGVTVYAQPVRRSPFCTDMRIETGPSEEWQAIAGQITIEVVPARDASGDARQRATVRLVGAVFVNSRGARVSQTQPITLTAIVGWFAG